MVRTRILNIYIYVFDLDLLLQKLGSRSLQPLTKTHSVDVSLIATKKRKYAPGPASEAEGTGCMITVAPLLCGTLISSLVH